MRQFSIEQKDAIGGLLDIARSGETVREPIRTARLGGAEIRLETAVPFMAQAHSRREIAVDIHAGRPVRQPSDDRP
jgi:hypothetical protein